MNTKDLITSLINTPSGVSDGTLEITNLIRNYFEQIGGFEITQLTSNGIYNIVASRGNGNGKTVVFNSHIDTIDSPADPVATSKGNFVFGLGAVNCKGSAASHILAAAQLADKEINGRVVFSFVGDEETFGDNGSKMLKDIGLLKPDYLIVGAPTDGKLIVEERGVLVFELTFKGKQAHAGNPRLGLNAIEYVIDASHYLLKTGILHPSNNSTSNLGLIRITNTTANVVPDIATVTYDCRYDGISADRFVKNLKNESKRMKGSTVEIITATEPFSTDKKSALVQALLPHTGGDFLYSIGSSDCRHFPECAEKVCFGPGDGDLGHTPKEKIDCNEIDRCASICVNLVKELLK